jgi:chorismate-pyruvate lyase
MVDQLRPSPQVIWTAPNLDGEPLTGPWQLLLLGDGSPTRHLQLLTGAAVEVEVAAMAAEPVGWLQPDQVRDLKAPLLRRQVWLICNGQTLAWAESWWNQAIAEQHLKERHQPIWRSLTANRTELFREVDGLMVVQEPWLQERFQKPGPFWCRHYRFFRQGSTLTVIREVFSPALEGWLGNACAAKK